MTFGISDLLSVDAILPNERPSSKKQLLQVLAKHAARLTGLDQRQIFDTLLQRERLGSTGVGNGIAIPHGKMADLDKIHGFFVRLGKPVEFESSDDQPVDIAFLLLAPENAGADHLKALSRVARILRDQGLVNEIRGNADAKAIHALLTREPAKNAA